jgi:hypothetical protein
MRSLRFSLIGVSLFALSASAEMMDRAGGFRIGQRLTIRPHVSFTATYDSNVGSSAHEEDDVMWTVNPGLNFMYHADRWYLSGSGYYSFNGYSETHKSISDYHNYGQTLTFGWDSSSKQERGWSLILNESFRLINESDDIALSDGSTYGRDSQEFNFTGVLERRITERLHASVNGGYYWLDYDNSNSAMQLYGWSRWTGGAEIGYAASKWFDLLLAATYQDYAQDNTKGYRGNKIDNGSTGTTLHIGFGSYATERISYRLLAGWTRFEYAGGANTSDGMTYSVSGKWQIGETWNLMVLAASYYQPSEREYATAQRTDAISFGVAKSLIRGKLNATFDACYRREGHTYSENADRDYNLDIITFRGGLNYTLNNYMTIFTRGEYRDSMSDKSGFYDYERFRLSVGIRLTY